MTKPTSHGKHDALKISHDALRPSRGHQAELRSLMTQAPAVLPEVCCWVEATGAEPSNTPDTYQQVADTRLFP